nr:hypothetical protein [Tanacetum cinerariifolium]
EFYGKAFGASVRRLDDSHRACMCWVWNEAFESKGEWGKERREEKQQSSANSAKDVVDGNKMAVFNEPIGSQNVATRSANVSTHDPNTTRQDGGLKERNIVCHEFMKEIPASYANKLSLTSLTKANLQKLDANVPNDVDYDVWLPLASVNEKVTMVKGVGIKRLHDDVRVTTAQLVLLVYKVTNVFNKVNAASSRVTTADRVTTAGWIKTEID